MLKRFLRAGRRSFDSLSEQEVLALAISSEEEDARFTAHMRKGCATPSRPPPVSSRTWRSRRTATAAS
jgi:hypothetical protein